ncbi:hypothetical protein Tco_0703128 [Tanacetum coccineum]|uniref:Uncharacterized protein n=1 Tax=Tanacetum coccineum TaxID=301880 RepID=A0ABQ4XZT4_9ASTR
MARGRLFVIAHGEYFQGTQLYRIPTMGANLFNTKTVMAKAQYLGWFLVFPLVSSVMPKWALLIGQGPRDNVFTADASILPSVRVCREVQRYALRILYIGYFGISLVILDNIEQSMD